MSHSVCLVHFHWDFQEPGPERSHVSFTIKNKSSFGCFLLEYKMKVNLVVCVCFVAHFSQNLPSLPDPFNTKYTLYAVKGY